jgi:hypothetical protein
MSLLDHIRLCQRRDMARFRPFMAGEAQVGWVRHETARQLARYDDIFAVDDRTVRLQPSLADFDSRSRAVADVGARLVEARIFRSWRNSAGRRCSRSTASLFPPSA